MICEVDCPHMHNNSHKLFQDFLGREMHDLGMTGGRVLDVGSKDVNGSYRQYFGDAWEYVGIDIENGPGVDLVVSASGKWKLGQMFDLVVCGQTLEHVPRPWILMKTVGRHIRKGGLMYLSAPFCWDHHSYPKDCYRYSPTGLSIMVKCAGCKPLRSELHNAGIEGKPYYSESVAIGYKTKDSMVWKSPSTISTTVTPPPSAGSSVAG